ncbi:hypothetical protein D3C71_1967770 [compost metagenome]
MVRVVEADAKDLGRIHDRWQVAHAVRVHCRKAAGYQRAEIVRGETVLQQLADILAVRVLEGNKAGVSESADVLDSLGDEGSEFHSAPGGGVDGAI